MTQFQENQLILPLRRLKAFDVDGNPFFVTVNTTEENDLEEEDQTAACDIDTVKAHDTIINKPENEEKIDQPEVPAINHERKQENTETKEKYKSYIKAFDQSFSKLQIQVSKRYFALKEETTKDDGKENRRSLLADKEIAQKLLDHWEMYYF
ncbi:CACNA1D [Mytilus coruscus]|uniref:CACNA1D n=1 Tax=Mytilus coruscus TaxID=42192 RepID=A0A6J8AE48_MYTCO|nr:CACNA1D [Mytilus coruscus]